MAVRRAKSTKVRSLDFCTIAHKTDDVLLDALDKAVDFVQKSLLGGGDQVGPSPTEAEELNENPIWLADKRKRSRASERRADQ